jgi:hypothetical protein
MKVASVTVRATAHGLWEGFQTAGIAAGVVLVSGAVIVAISVS